MEKFLAQQNIAVVLRSNEVNPEPRTQRALSNLEKAGYSVLLINWERASSTNSSGESTFPRRSFRLKAPYGAGLWNLVKQLRWQLWLIKNLLQLNCQLIYSCDADTGLAALFVSKVRRRFFIYDQFDPISSRFKNRIICSIGDYVENLLFRESDLSIVATESRRMISARNQIVVSNFPTEVQARPSTSKESRGLKLVYFGVLHEDRGIRTLLESVKDAGDVELTIAGYGPLSKVISQYSNNKISYLGKVSHQEGLEILSKADASVAFYDSGSRQNVVTASSKFIDSILMGTPCITSSGIELATLVTEFGLGWAIPYGDKESFVRLINQLGKVKGELINNFDLKRDKYLEKVNPRREELTLQLKLAALRKMGNT